MKMVDLIEHVKSSKDPNIAGEFFVRFKIKKLEDGRLMLVRSMTNEQVESGSISTSPIFDKNGRPMSLNDLPEGVLSMNEVEKMLNGCLVGLAVPSSVEDEDFKRFGWISSNLGGAELEYSAISREEADAYSLPVETLALDFLNTNMAYRKMGFARGLIQNADKFAQLNNFRVMFGIGIPFDKEFCIFNKTMNEWGFVMQYQKTCKERQIEFDPQGAVVNLAVFYKRLGFDIYPIESGHFLIEKRTSESAISKNDEKFLKAKKSELDNDVILFER